MQFVNSRKFEDNNFDRENGTKKKTRKERQMRNLMSADDHNAECNSRLKGVEADKGGGGGG